MAQQPVAADLPDPATVAFQRAIPYLLHSTSPTFAALHGTRHSLQQLSQALKLSPLHCPRCSSFLPDAGVKESRRKSRSAASCSRSAVVRSCVACGFSLPHFVKNNNSSTAPFPAARKTHSRGPLHRTRCLGIPIQLPSSSPPMATGPTFTTDGRQSLNGTQISAHVESANPTVSAIDKNLPSNISSAVGSDSALASRSKSRAKKKAGLQELLARNRERQEKEKKDAAGVVGLSAFLGGLG